MGRAPEDRTRRCMPTSRPASQSGDLVPRGFHVCCRRGANGLSTDEIYHDPVLSFALEAPGAGSENYYSLVLPSSSLILPAFPSQRRYKSESSPGHFPITGIRIYDRPPPEGADRSGLNDCHSRICSDTSFFSRSSVAFSHRRRSSLRRPSTNPTRPDLPSGLSRLPYPMFRLLPF
jgi:hypothetical protein